MIVEFKPEHVQEDLYEIIIYVDGKPTACVHWIDLLEKRITKGNRRGFGWKGAKSLAKKACE